MNIFKPYLLLGVLCICSVSSNAQELRKFKFGLGFTYSPTQQNGFDAPAGIYFEPAIRYSDDYAFGLQLGAYSGSQELKDNTGRTLTTLNATIQYNSFTVNRFFDISKRTKAFVGLVAGLSTYIEDDTIQNFVDNRLQFEVDEENQTGMNISPRFGLSVGNFVFSGTAMLHTNGLPNFFLFQLGFDINGGRKKKTNYSTTQE